MKNSATEPSVGSWELVAAAHAGDADAFGELYLRYADQIIGYLICRVGRDRGLVEDLTQETFLRAWRRLDTVSNNRGGNVAAWLRTIARNLLIDHHKRGHGYYERLVEELPDLHPSDTAVPSAEQQALEQMDRDSAAITVRRCLSALPPAQRLAVQLSDLQPGGSLTATAAAMGRSVRAVATARWRARQGMASWLAAEGARSRAPRRCWPWGERYPDAHSGRPEAVRR